MAPTVAFEPVRVETGCRDTVGRLAFVGGALVAVLVRLDDPMHDDDQRGGWVLEAGFGRAAAAAPPVFGGLDAAAAWLARRLGPA